MNDNFALTILCNFLNEEFGYSFTPESVVFFIRQLSIADGCGHSCSHCFSNSKREITQTRLDGFARIIQEIGHTLIAQQSHLDFFHLGASCDPAYIQEYHNYLKVWIDNFPNDHIIKVFSHGWDLSNSQMKDDLQNTLSEATHAQNPNVRFILSFDPFSKLARSNWSQYIENMSNNLRLIESYVGKEKVRLEVFYPPERNLVNEQQTLQYWRDCITNTAINFEHIFPQIERFGQNACSRITVGALEVLQRSGFNATDIPNMVRDCNIIFPAGRGIQHFSNPTDMKIGLNVQKSHVLYSLDNYKYKYNGVLIYPNGSARLVDYYGFRLGNWLNNGNPVIPYLKEIN